MEKLFRPRREFLRSLAASPFMVGALARASMAETGTGGRVSRLEITILSTMLADEGFGEWGFAALVEVDGKRFLFDTGAHEDTVLRNLKVKGLDLSDVEAVVLSHNHADHTTGLMPLRRQFASMRATALGKAYVGRGIFWPRISSKGQVDDRMAAVKRDFEAKGGSFVEVGRLSRSCPESGSPDRCRESILNVTGA